MKRNVSFRSNEKKVSGQTQLLDQTPRKYCNLPDTHNFVQHVPPDFLFIIGHIEKHLL
jgi:hypothetical protein